MAEKALPDDAQRIRALWNVLCWVADNPNTSITDPKPGNAQSFARGIDYLQKKYPELGRNSIQAQTGNTLAHALHKRGILVSLGRGHGYLLPGDLSSTDLMADGARLLREALQGTPQGLASIEQRYGGLLADDIRYVLEVCKVVGHFDHTSFNIESADGLNQCPPTLLPGLVPESHVIDAAIIRAFPCLTPMEHSAGNKIVEDVRVNMARVTNAISTQVVNGVPVYEVDPDRLQRLTPELRALDGQPLKLPKDKRVREAITLCADLRNKLWTALHNDKKTLERVYYDAVMRKGTKNRVLMFEENEAAA
jgi:hypothetical protein